MVKILIIWAILWISIIQCKTCPYKKNMALFLFHQWMEYKLDCRSSSTAHFWFFSCEFLNHYLSFASNFLFQLHLSQALSFLELKWFQYHYLLKSFLPSLGCIFFLSFSLPSSFFLAPLPRVMWVGSRINVPFLKRIGFGWNPNVVFPLNPTRLPPLPVQQQRYFRNLAIIEKPYSASLF